MRPKEGIPESMAEELSSLVTQVERVVQACECSLSQESTHEWDLLVKRLKAVMAQRPSAPSGKTSHSQTPDTAAGIAFAAGSLPLGARQMMTVTSLGWVFAAGLLFGLLIRRR